MRKIKFFAAGFLAATALSAFGFAACGGNNTSSSDGADGQSATVVSIDGGTVSGDKIFILADKDVTSLAFGNKVVCSKGSVWKLYYDQQAQQEIPSKVAVGQSGSLTDGNNLFYLVASSKDGSLVNVYEVTVHKSYAAEIKYYDGETLLKTETAYTGEEFSTDYVPTIEGYTFNDWNYEKAVLWEDLTLYADKTANDYTVTYDVNGGDTLTEAEKTVTYDEEFSFAKPTKTGYAFLGWYDGQTPLTDGTGKSLFAWKNASDVTVKAEWQANEYTLTANKTDGGTVTGGGKYLYGESVTLTAATEDGHVWLGWYDQEGTQVSDKQTYQFTMGLDATYTAKWAKLTIEENLPEAGGIESHEKKYVVGQQLTLTATTAAGYTWLGWYDGDTLLTAEASYTFTVAAKDTTYTAKWTYYTLTTNTNLEEAGNYSQYTDKKVSVGEQRTVTATTKQFYTWLGWYDGETLLTTELSYTFTMPAENIVYTAKWTYYILTVDSNMKNAGRYDVECGWGTTVEADGVASGKVEAATQVELTAESNAGYTWLGWYDGETLLTAEKSYTFEMPAKDVHCTAKWSKVTINKNMPLAGTVTELTESYVLGQEVTVTATSNLGYTFLGWYEGETLLSAEESYTFVTSKKSATYTAKWTYYTLTTNANINEAGSYTTYSNWKIKVGIDVNLTATTNVGYDFIGWYDGETLLSADPNYTFVMPAENITYEAKWEVAKELRNFEFTLVGSICKITGIKDKTVEAIVVPDYVTAISEGAFSGCANVKEITLPFVGGLAGNAEDEASEYRFGYIFGKTAYDGGVATDQDISTANNDTYYIPAGLTTVTVTGGGISELAFCQCDGLTKVTLGNGVTGIGTNAFYDCDGLSVVSIGNGVKRIENAAFILCENLTVVTMENGLQTIGQYAFRMCGKLTEVAIPDSVTSIEKYAFAGCSGLLSVTIGKNVKEIGGSAFNSCTALETVYYKGTAADWAKITISNESNSYLKNATVYYYSESEPALNAGGTAYDGNYWRYVEGVITVWTKEN